MESIETTVGLKTEINSIMLFKSTYSTYIEESFLMTLIYQFTPNFEIFAQSMHFTCKVMTKTIWMKNLLDEITTFLDLNENF